MCFFLKIETVLYYDNYFDYSVEPVLIKRILIGFEAIQVKVIRGKYFRTGKDYFITLCPILLSLAKA